MKNVPNKIYLNLGEIDDDVDFKDLTQVTWLDKKCFKNDIEFIHNPDGYYDLLIEQCEKIVSLFDQNKLTSRELIGLKILLGK